MSIQIKDRKGPFLWLVPLGLVISESLIIQNLITLEINGLIDMKVFGDLSKRIFLIKNLFLIGFLFNLLIDSFPLIIGYFLV